MLFIILTMENKILVPDRYITLLKATLQKQGENHTSRSEVHKFFKTEKKIQNSRCQKDGMKQVQC
jgi:hypothetical protein